MFRLGYGLEPRPTPRRAVDDVLRRMQRESPRIAALALRRPAVTPAPFEVAAPSAIRDAPAVLGPPPLAAAAPLEAR
jgi:hypothetical protein